MATNQGDRRKMAVYKLDILSRFGKFYAAFYAAETPKPNPTDNKPLNSMEEVLAQINEEIKKHGLDEEQDTIIFRNIGYDDYTKLAREVRMGTY